MLNINILSAFIYLEMSLFKRCEGQSVGSRVCGWPFISHIKDIVSFPSGLEYLHQAGNANFKPGYLFVIFLLFFLVALTFFFMWSLWSYHGTLGHVCSSELRKKKNHFKSFSLSFWGSKQKSVQSLGIVSSWRSVCA